MGKENSSGAANGGENKNNKRRPFYRKSQNGNGETNNVVTTKKVKEMKFYLHDSDKRKTSESFGRIKESIVLKIQKSFEDTIYLSELIINKCKKTFTKPTKSQSTLGDADAKALENEMYLEEWKIDFGIYRKDERKFDEAWVKVYELIWDTYCSREIQTALKEMSTFETKIRNDPLFLLDMIEILIHTPEKEKYPSLTLVEALCSFLKVRQGENEELVEYLSRFKTERDITFRLLGRGLIDGFSEKLPEYLAASDTEARGKMSKKMSWINLHRCYF